MKLNLEIIAHALAEAEEARLYGPPCEELDLEGARFFAGESQPGQLWLFEGCWPPPGFSGSALCRAPRGPVFCAPGAI